MVWIFDFNKNKKSEVRVFYCHNIVQFYNTNKRDLFYYTISGSTLSRCDKRLHVTYVSGGEERS